MYNEGKENSEQHVFVRDSGIYQSIEMSKKLERLHMTREAGRS